MATNASEKINYIIVSRVLNMMTETMRDFRKAYGITDTQIEIPSSDIKVVNGLTLPADDIWRKILQDKSSLEQTDKGIIGKWLTDIVDNNGHETYLFIHFGGQNDNQIKEPLKKLQGCFDSKKVSIIPFTVNATSGGTLVNATFLNHYEKGDLTDALIQIKNNYVARTGVFGWLEAYEQSILNGGGFVRPDTHLDNNRDNEARFSYLKLELKAHKKTEKTDEDIKFVKFKVGTWDAERQCPKVAQMTDFKAFRKDFERMTGQALAYPREEIFDAWLIVNPLKDLAKSVHNPSSSEGVATWFLNDPKPILSVGLMPLWQMSDEENAPKCAAFREEYLDSRAQFWDSCIWLRYVPLLGEDWANSQAEAFKNVINAFDTYKNQRFYAAISSREFFEFQLRLYRNSFVSSVANDVYRAHGGAVTPFGFHSETKMAAKGDLIVPDLKYLRYSKGLKDLRNLKWRILLVDDTSDKGLRTINNAQTLDIKSKIVSDAFKNTELIELKSAVDFDLAKAQLTNEAEHCDIILLDYFFQEKGMNKFGIDFLNDFLKDPNYLDVKYLGPLGKYYIVPISVYQNALTDNLRNSAILTHGDKWLITQGTDPLNKPHLFRYTLLQLMDRQQRKASRELDILKEISESNLMNDMRKYYNDLMKLGVKLDNLHKFNQPNKKSLLAHSICEKYEIGYSKHLGAHLQHMIYLINSGNTTYKTQIWAEYFWLKAKMMTDNKEFWHKIEKYIKNL